MLIADQIAFFKENGYLVVGGVLDQQKVIDPIKAEYAALLDNLCEEWFKEGPCDDLSERPGR